MLNQILNEIDKGTVADKGAEQAVIKLGVSQIPEVAKDNTDRNRTSPFAFTGNKFEFRAVGSSASTAFPITVLNAAVADGMTEVVAILRESLKAGKKNEEAIMDTVRKIVKETEKVRFEGNGYSEDWVKEAARRGLPNLRKTPEALAQLAEPKAVEVFSKFEIFSSAEVHSRLHVRLERYVKNLQIEVETLRSMIDTQVLPACYAYSGDLAMSVKANLDAGVPAPQKETLVKLNTLLTTLHAKRKDLEATHQKAESVHGEEDKAKLYAAEVSTAMTDVRSVVDELESMVGDDYWPLPKYREMLFFT
jgi:glutamine synthetase